VSPRRRRLGASRRRPGPAAGRHVCVAEPEAPLPLHPLLHTPTLCRATPRRSSPPWSRRTAPHQWGGGTLSSSRPRRPGPPCRCHGPRTSAFRPVDRAFTLARDSSQWPGRHQAATSYSGPRARAQGARWYWPTKPLSSTSPSTCSSNFLNQQH
jgi:hypothetical protein